MRKIAILLASVVLSAQADAYTANYNQHALITAIGGLEIGGVLVDVSFDGAFGSTDVASVGLDPLSAALSLQAVANDRYLDPRNYRGFLFPWFNTESQRLFQVEAASGAYTAVYGAGWVCCITSVATNAGDLASFRLSIPGSVIDSPISPVPEVPTWAALAVGLVGIGAAVRRRSAFKLASSPALR